MSQVMVMTGQACPEAAILMALRDYVRLTRRQSVLALRGQVDITDDWRALRGEEVSRDGV
jgi:hypothetical protein